MIVATRRRSRLSRGEFARVFEQGTATRGPLLILRVLENDVGEPRWGFAVGKRLLPGAVDRNRLRRRLAELARQAQAEGGYDVIVIARPGAPEARTTELRHALHALLRRAAVLRAP